MGEVQKISGEFVFSIPGSGFSGRRRPWPNRSRIAANSGSAPPRALASLNGGSTENLGQIQNSKSKTRIDPPPGRAGIRIRIVAKMPPRVARMSCQSSRKPSRFAGRFPPSILGDKAGGETSAVRNHPPPGGGAGPQADAEARSRGASGTTAAGPARARNLGAKVPGKVRAACNIRVYTQQMFALVGQVVCTSGLLPRASGLLSGPAC